MAHRLVLGCGSIGHAVVAALADTRGDLSVIDTDGERVETLRNEGIPASRGDPTDPAVVAGAVEGDRRDGNVRTSNVRVETVFVAGDDAATNLLAAETARDVYPGASLVVYVGERPDVETREAVDAVADRTIDRGAVLVDRVLGTIEGEDGPRLRDLRTTLGDVPGRLGVFTHDNPDPDAIASAVALADVAESVGTEADVCYFGDISHQENRALVNVLELDLRNLEPEEFDVEEYDGIALVDHSRPGVNDQLPEGLAVDVVIDHHPPRAAVGGRFVDLRDDVGATSTLLTGYYSALGTEIDETVATALLYGIRVDTRDFGREITPTDFEAAAYLIENADVDALTRIESPSVTGEMLSVLARAIANREVRDSVLATSAGWTVDRDALAQAADTLLAMDGVSTVLVLGLLEDTDTVVASARTRGSVVDIGEALRLAYAQIGSAGGHTDMAGAQIPLGILGAVEDETGSLEEVIGDVLVDRFFEVLEDEGVLEPAGRPTPTEASGEFLRGGLARSVDFDGEDGTADPEEDDRAPERSDQAPDDADREPGEADREPDEDDRTRRREENDFSPRDPSA